MEKCEPAAAAADPGMKILVRQVLYNAVCGRPFSQYPDDILMLRHHGVAGRTARHSEEFSPLVGTAGAKLLRQMQQKHLAEVILGGLGGFRVISNVSVMLAPLANGIAVHLKRVCWLAS